MGWRDVLKRSISGSGPDWQAWAKEHGWTYEAPAPDLVDRFYAPPTIRGSGEDYVWAARGTHGSLGFILFERKVWVPPRPGGAKYHHTLHLAVHLPRAPRADIRAVDPRTAFKSLGGSLTGRFEFEWQGTDWMVGQGRGAEPAEVETLLQHIETQIALAPEDIWDS